MRGRTTTGSRLVLGCLWIALGCARPAVAAPLWQVEHDDHSFLLLGSVHVLGSGTVEDDALLRDAYRRSDALVFELDLNAVTANELGQLFRERAVSADGRGLAELVGDDFWPDVVAAAQAANIPLDQYRRSEPWYAAMQVTQQLLTAHGFKSDFGVETILGNWAVRDGKPIRGLETLEQQIALFDNLSLDAQRRLLHQTLAEADGLGDDLQRLSRAWREADLDFLSTELLAQLDGIPELREALLVRRNKTWANLLIALPRDAQRRLVVVGALHLVGPDSLIELLESEGYRIRKIEARPL
ncbi:MAG: TraB/GumN family protein [Pseudomonadota bacterium]